MMQSIKKFGFVLLFTAGLGACQKKVTDLKPIDVIPSEVAIQNISDVTAGVNGVYGTWNARRSVYLSSFLTDEVRLGTGTEYRNIGNALFNWQFVSDSQDWRDAETGGVFTNLYAVIDRANRLLEFMVPVIPANPAEDALKTQYRGELLALRAMANLELLRFYSETAEYTADRAGIILQTEYVKNPGSYKPKRNSQGEVMASIDADLASARTLIPTTFVNISRVTRNAVIATQARAALHTRNWQAVVDRSTEVINLQPISARTAYAAIWNQRTVLENQNTEVIWKLNINGTNVGASIGLLFQDAGSGALQAGPAVKLLNTFDQVNDIRFSTFFKTTPRNLIAKYGAFITGNGENFQYDIKMIRTSELILARAEANAELNKLTEANADLASLRAARITGYAHTAISDKAAFITAVVNERYKELCYEGQRYFDLKRRSLAIVRDAADVGANTGAVTLPATNFRYILPIPQQELFANPNFGQNAGY